MPEYQHLTRDEPLNLAQEKEQLTDEARLALDSEISSRRIEPTEISGYARESLARQRAAERPAQRLRISYEGRNKRFIGKRNRRLDPRLRVEEFETTLWFMFLVPVFPIGSYRIRRRFRRWWNPCRPWRLHILDVRSRDWEQIVSTWAKAAGIVIAVGLAWFAVRKFHF